MEDKKIATPEVQAQEQLKVKNKAQTSLNKLLEGKKTINEIRIEFDLLPLENESALLHVHKFTPLQTNFTI